MSLDCIGVSDAIWDSVREGTELTEEELSHIRSCDSCASALAEARASVVALSCVRPYPAVPDCRSAVMDRISARRTRLAPVWSYACAVMVVGITVVGAVLWPQNQGPAPNRLAAPPRAAKHIPRETQPLPRPETDARAPEPETPRARHLHSRTRPRHKVLPVNTVASATPTPTEVTSDRQSAPPADDTRALAYVTWSTANQPSDSYQYGYTVADPSTGEVTKCSVKREGNTIEINMESEPVEPKAKPVKESKSDEAIRCS